MCTLKPTPLYTSKACHEKMASKMEIQTENHLATGEILCASVYEARETISALSKQTLTFLWPILCHLAHHKPAIISNDSIAWLTQSGTGTVKRRCHEMRWFGLLYEKKIKGESFYRLTPRALSIMRLMLEAAQETHV